MDPSAERYRQKQRELNREIKTPSSPSRRRIPQAHPTSLLVRTQKNYSAGGRGSGKENIPPQKLTNRQIAQRQRREREREAKASGKISTQSQRQRPCDFENYLTPPPTFRHQLDAATHMEASRSSHTRLATQRHGLAAIDPIPQSRLATPSSLLSTQHFVIADTTMLSPSALTLDDGDESEEEFPEPLRMNNATSAHQNPPAHLAPLSLPCLRPRNAPNRPLFAIARQPFEDPAGHHNLGHMSDVYSFCGAFHWKAERLTASTKSKALFGTCCNSGKVELPLLFDPPEPLAGLFTGADALAQEFRDNILQYNSALAFMSLGAQMDDSVNRFGPRQWVYRIQGQLYHLSGALNALEGHSPSYAQLYFYQPEIALQQRMHCNSNVVKSTMQDLQNMIHKHNPYTRIYEHAYEILQQYEVSDAAVHLRVMPGTDLRRYNLPSADEVAVILPGDGGKGDSRDIILRKRVPPDCPNLCRISERHAAYFPLHYVLLFPYGEPGWHEDLKLVSNGGKQPKRLTQTRFAAYRLHPRRSEFSTILHGGRLLQQFAVDAWACADQNRLQFLHQNQNKLRASLYSGLEDAVTGDDAVDLHDLGQRFVLPSSYIGGPRHMQQRFQDAMAIARYYRKVDIFLTMTTNPEWDEIQHELEPHQTAYDRPDLVARVFEMKKKALIDDLYNNGIFGCAVAYVYTIEYQKRTLPHMHLLLMLDREFKLSTTEAIDECISAQWPDPTTQPQLFKVVHRHMVHGPCGAMNYSSPCMENGLCTKHYPKAFQEQTTMGEDGYPLYARPDDGHAYNVRGQTVDNRWLVPYSPYLCAKYNCHINVECAVNIRSIKYPFKYITKGGDRATLEMQQDEIKNYIDGRYVSAAEAVRRILHFDTHHQVPSVMRLQVHLSGQHMVNYNPDDTMEDVMARAKHETTTLTAFFATNAQDDGEGEIMRSLLYQEVPQEFVYNLKKKPPRWTLRKKGEMSIGRMFFVSPRAGERFYLRLLLTVVRGPTSFEDLRTYRGVIYDTFKDACLARGLLESDGEWRQCLEDASIDHTGARLRHLFVTILLFCFPSEPEKLWNKFRESICDDLAYHLRRTMGWRDLQPETIFDYGLYLIENSLIQAGASLSDYPNMPLPHYDWCQNVEHSNPLIAEQIPVNEESERQTAENLISCFNPEQAHCFQQITESAEQSLGSTFFVNGPGGTGKTFLYKAVIHYLRGRGHIVLCVASSGIAALLLPGGRTAHSVFKIPIDGLTEDSYCSIKKESSRAEMMRRASTIIWDEAIMQHRHAPENLDRTLRDICGNDQLFGGLTVVFGGDFRQILPVVPKGTHEDIINASLHKSQLWNSIEILRLHRNERLIPGSEQDAFARWLLEVGDGTTIRENDSSIPFPPSMRVQDANALMKSIYPNLEDCIPSSTYFSERVILTARNHDVDALNEELLQRMPGGVRTYHSMDSVVTEAGVDDLNEAIPPEYLRSLSASGLPPGELNVKLGCPLILLRNLSPAQGLCNGTRLLLRRMTDRVLEAEILGGAHHGESVLIPRISVIPTGKSNEYSFMLKRRQFPVRLAFVISIHKAQGQSVQHVGLDLRVPVFTHGQLYVAFSRATSHHQVKVLLPSNSHSARTTNVVYPEVLQ